VSAFLYYKVTRQPKYSFDSRRSDTAPIRGLFACVHRLSSEPDCLGAFSFEKVTRHSRCAFTFFVCFSETLSTLRGGIPLRLWYCLGSYTLDLIVTSCAVPPAARCCALFWAPRGFGFVTYKTAEGAKKAIDAPVKVINVSLKRRWPLLCHYVPVSNRDIMANDTMANLNHTHKS